MNKREYREILDKLNMSQVGAARLLGVSDRSSRRFASGDDIPQVVALLLVAMRDWKITPEKLFKAAGLKLPRESFSDPRPPPKDD